jgi:hypothetical protein
MMIDLRKKENLHIVFWLIKDFAWLANIKWLGVSMAIPTILLAIWLTWKSRPIRSDWFHNLAVTCWISGNATWMWREFFYEDTLRIYAYPFFIVGFACIAWYYSTEFYFKTKQPTD